MTKRRLGLGGIILFMMAIAVWVTLPKHNGSSGSAASGAAPTIPADEAPVQAAHTPAKPLAASSLWTRPTAEVASRNRRKAGFAWVLRPLGATEQQLNRLVGGDLHGVVAELKQKAQAGDPASIHVLGQLAQLNCGPSYRGLAGAKRRQIDGAQALPPADRDWFASTVNDDIAFDKQIDSVCDQIDTKEVLSWVTARADQGDGASLWVLSEAGLPMKDLRQRLRDASAGGFALAQSVLAPLILYGGDDSAAGPGGADTLNPAEVLNQAASVMPASKSDLANCEYFGDCQGIPVDIDAAIAHAREAAQEGYFNAILRIGPHLPAGQMDPNEVTAWSLIDASVHQQGCGGGIFTVRAMQNIMSTLSAPSITAAAREQAEQLWSEYGAQIKANLGCDS
jgi:hypothetical protein